MSIREQVERTVLFVGGPRHGELELLHGHLAETWRHHGGRETTHYYLREGSLNINGRMRAFKAYAVGGATTEMLVDAIEKSTAVDAKSGQPSKLWTPN